MPRILTFIANKLNETAFGDPPKQWKSAVFFIVTVYFDLVEKFVYFLPRTELYINEQNTWQNFNWHVCVDFFGSLICLCVAPIIDNYLIHQYMVVACHGVVSLLSIFYTYTVFLPPSETVSQASLLALSGATQFTKPIFISYAMLQLPERVGPPSKFVFTGFFTTSLILIGFIQVALRWARTERSYSSINVLSLFLITTYPVVMGVFITLTILKRNAFRKSGSKPGETFLALRCLGRAARLITTGSCFETMLNYFDYTTVMNCKKATKVFVIVLALSFNSTILRIMDLPWMFQYFTLNRTGLFRVIEFNALCTFFTAIFIPITEYLLIPFMRKLKLTSYIPTYSLMLYLAYFFTCIASGLSIWMQVQTEKVQTTRLDYNTARIYLINSLDTYSYVKARGFPKTRIPSASVKPYLVGDDHLINGRVRIDFKIFNLYYGVNNDLVRFVEPRSTTAYVLTVYGAYDLPANGLTQMSFKVISDPSYITLPTLMFLCPRNISVGAQDAFYPWCEATVKIWIYGGPQSSVIEQELNLKEVGNGTVMSIQPDAIVSIQMAFPADFNHDKNIIEFSPVQGGKYLLLVWAGDVDLRVKYRLITVHTPPMVNTYYALPQIICRALGFALGIVSLCTMVKINTPHSLFTVSWALLSLSTKIFIPGFLVLNYLALRDSRYQLSFVVINFALFFTVIVAVRIART